VVLDVKQKGGVRGVCKNVSRKMGGLGGGSAEVGIGEHKEDYQRGKIP